MGLTTYSGLKTHIEARVDDSTSYTSHLDDFTYLVESTINNRLRVKEMISRETAPLNTSSRYLAHPTDYIEMKRFRLLTSPISELTMVFPENVTSFDSTGSAQPEFFSDVDEQLEFERIPSSAITAEMVFYKKVSPLVTSSTNAILTAYPHIYVYGMLSELFKFAFEEDKAEMYEAKFNYYIDVANQAEKRRSNNALALSTNADMPGVSGSSNRSIITL